MILKASTQTNMITTKKNYDMDNPIKKQKPTLSMEIWK